MGILTGEATSNVFDGTRWLGDDPSSGLLVKGIDGDRIGTPTVGFLSEHEAMKYLSVGTLLKHPAYPLWVVGSPTHYTILFSVRRSDAQLSEEAQLEQRTKKVFADHALDEGLAMSTNLGAMLQGVGIGADMLPQAQRELVHEDIVLWEDFISWVKRHFGVSGTRGEATKLQLYLYDGQDPPGPTLRTVSLELNDIDPSLAGGDDDTFTKTINTRWPNAVVTVQQA